MQRGFNQLSEDIFAVFTGGFLSNRHMKCVGYLISETFIYLQNRNDNDTASFYKQVLSESNEINLMSKAPYKYVATAVNF